jgi:hypothetical protein
MIRRAKLTPHREAWCAARFSSNAGRWGMMTVETIGRIRREHFLKGKTIKEIARDLKVSRSTVRKVVRSGPQTPARRSILRRAWSSCPTMWTGTPDSRNGLLVRGGRVSCAVHTVTAACAIIHRAMYAREERLNQKPKSRRKNPRGASHLRRRGRLQRRTHPAKTRRSRGSKLDADRGSIWEAD